MASNESLLRNYGNNLEMDCCGHEMTCVESAPPIFVFYRKIMDETASFPGLGKQVSAVLKPLAVDMISEPVWTLKQTSGQIYLAIIWTKIKFSTIQPTTKKENKSASCVQQKPQLEQVDCETCTAPSSNSSLKVKDKAPSTRRRD